jgi:hypothetical protein
MKRSKGAQLIQFAKLRNGLPQVIGTSEKVQVQGGEEVKISDVPDFLDTIDANARAVEEGRGNFDRTVAAERDFRAKASPTIMALCARLLATLPPEQLELCGLSLKKPQRALLAEELAAKAAKSRETRKANGTRGKRQIRQEEAKAVLTATYASNGNGRAPGGGGAH